MTAPRPGARAKAPDGAPLAFARAAVMHEGSECLEWPYGKTEGYGRLVVGGVLVYAHDLICSAWEGPMPANHECCHSCDNRACVNPFHLRWGTRQDNVDDMMARRGHWSQSV